MIDGLRDRWRRPAQVWSLVLFDIVGAALCLAVALFPPSDRTPRPLQATGFVLASAFAIVLWWLGRNAPRWLFHLNAATHVVFSTVLVANAATGEGAMSVTFYYIVLAMYAALFFGRRAARRYLVLIVGSAFAGALINPAIEAPVMSLLPMLLSAVAAVEVLGTLRGLAASLVVTDSLTGLLNRAGFTSAARREQVAAARTHEPLTVVAVDLDGFKAVNDRDGHAAGDALLRSLAAEWRTGLRARDIVSRRGGDEFTFLLPGTTEHEAEVLFERLHEGSCSRWSYGLAAVELDADVECSLERADARMYERKDALRRAG